MPFKDKLPPLYYVWSSMRDRCRNPRAVSWKNYGARGIKICPEWDSFATFASDMGERPAGYSLDRIDNDGNYEPGNCRWATRREQAMNRRNAVYVTVEGVRYRAIELAEIAGLKTDVIVERANAELSLEEVLSPKRRHNLSGFSLGVAANKKKSADRTHCSKGHEFTVANLMVDKHDWKHCRQCHNAKMRARNAAKRVQVVQAPISSAG